MGSKGAVRRLRRVYRCDECIKTFRNLQALCLHKKTEHSTNKSLNKMRNKKLPDDAPKKPDEPLPETDIHDSPESTPGEVKKKLLGNVKRKIEFSCPKCDKTFNVYFSAFRHVQKYHCEDSEGNPVKPNSPNLIKPLRREQCSTCLKVVKSTEFHTCFESQNIGLPLEKYACVGCGQDFSSIKTFDIHVAGVHNEHVQSLFFPSRVEFVDWKERMEKQTKSKYTLMSRYSSKEFYRCSLLPTTDDVTQFCPSSIVFQSFTKGVQIHYYPLHFGHSNVLYYPTMEDQKYCITSMLVKAEGYQDLEDMKFERNDLYSEFKNLMEHIVLEAAKLNIKSLKNLMGRALYMSSTLREYDEDAEVSQEVPGFTFLKKGVPTEKPEEKHEKHLSDKQIGSELQESESAPVKTLDLVRTSNRIRRRSTLSSRPDFIQEPLVKKSRSSPLVDNGSSAKKLKQNNDIDIVLDKPELETHEPLAQLRIVDTFSLNADVLKQNNNQLGVNNVKEKLQLIETERKENHTPKDESQIIAPKVSTPENNTVVKEQQPKVRFSLSQSQSFNDSYKEFVDKNFKSENITRGLKQKKVVMKTKIGQYLPSSPRRNTTSSPNSSPKIDDKVINNEVTPSNKSKEQTIANNNSMTPVKNGTNPIFKSDPKVPLRTYGKANAKGDTKSKSETSSHSKSDKSNSKTESKPNSKNETKSISKNETKASSKNETKSNSKSETKPTPKSETKSTPKGETKSTPRSETKPTPKTETKSTPKTETKSTPKGETKSTPKTETKSTPKGETKSTPKTETKSTPKSETKSTPKTETKSTPKGETKSTPKTETKSAPKSESKSTPKSEPAKPISKTEAKITKNGKKSSLESASKTKFKSKSMKAEIIKKKIDIIRYEVKEQENDCNILVLKI